ncbi:uncharacterized protein LOC121429872 [Lytechinus variegatus]|uniref:uncharacterized protein LOC121429872 n=1 Tax=Lytechinus variegatus TaxID=7654 RepID=UPI001BB2A669|nr:uncharacterized protein LOC121429872 [Lytechinus variegatus]
MDQKLLLPPAYSPTTEELKSPVGQLPTRLAPIFTTPQKSCEHDRSRGGLCRTIVLCVLALAICAGFVLLYFQMKDLQHQVQELQLQVEEGSDIQFDEHETPPDQGNHDETPDPDKADSDGSIHYKEHTRERRSINGHHGNGGSRRRLPRPMQVGDPSAHVVPLASSQPQSHMYPASAWFVWTDQESYSHASIPLRMNKFLIAPHAGYYFIYAQVTIETCNNNTLGRGHSLYVKTHCGRQIEKRLTHTQTSPAFNTLHICTYDSSYTGGVYYLEANDHIGVKPFVPLGLAESRLHLTEDNSYFGMIQLSKFERGTRGDCSLQIPQF